MPRLTRPNRAEQNALRRIFYDRIRQGDLSIPEAMKAMREVTGLTQAEFAAHRGVSRRVIQDIERGTGNPTLESLNSIAKLFGLQVGLVPIQRSTAVSPALADSPPMGTAGRTDDPPGGTG